MANKFSIININKGDSGLQNRVPQILHLLDKYKPTLMCINELNLRKNDDITPGMFPNYKLEYDNLRVTDDRSRTGILVHNDVKYHRRRDLETKGLATVWIQVSQPGSKPLLVQSAYRQLQRIGKPGSGTPTRQAQRWTQLLDKWLQASRENKELITLGDLNVKKMAWDLHPTQMSTREKSQNTMVQELKDKILSQGFPRYKQCTHKECWIIHRKRSMFRLHGHQQTEYDYQPPQHLPHIQ